MFILFDRTHFFNMWMNNRIDRIKTYSWAVLNKTITVWMPNKFIKQKNAAAIMSLKYITTKLSGWNETECSEICVRVFSAVEMEKKIMVFVIWICEMELNWKGLFRSANTKNKSGIFGEHWPIRCDYYCRICTLSHETTATKQHLHICSCFIFL